MVGRNFRVDEGSALKMEVEKLKEVTILYCEDETELHDVTANLLRRLAKTVLTAHDGEEGLRLYREHQNEIDMVITDIGMPKMNGLDMTREIKALTPRIPVIVTTAYSSTDHLFEAIDIHVDKYVLKPLDTRKLVEAMIQSLLYHELRSLYRDPLTGLLTRNALLNDLKKNKSNRLVLISIERFAYINDLYGDEVGGSALVGLTEKLRESFSETFEIYRTGFDSFVLSDLQMDRTPESMRHLLETFAAQCKNDGMVVEEIPIYLVLRFAMAYSDDGHTLYYAQRAMQKANENHQQIIEYTPRSSNNISNWETNIWWTKELNNAIEHGRFTPYFQPIVDTETLQTYKYEALVRYRGTEGKLFGPVVFLGIAKKTNLYPMIMRVVLRKVIEVIRQKRIRVAVNISYVDLINQDTMDFIDQMLREHPEEAAFLEFEILESEKIDNYDLAGDFIRSIRRYGCQVGIDDFGTGYSNFGMIEALKVDYVKINGLLIQGIHESDRQALIVETIHTFCQKLGIKTVAEMVSCEEEYLVVKRIGIDLTQGWYVSREIDGDEITDG